MCEPNWWIFLSNGIWWLDPLGRDCPLSCSCSSKVIAHSQVKLGSVAKFCSRDSPLWYTCSCIVIVHSQVKLGSATVQCSKVFVAGNTHQNKELWKMPISVAGTAHPFLVPSSTVLEGTSSTAQIVGDAHQIIQNCKECPLKSSRGS